MSDDNFMSLVKILFWIAVIVAAAALFGLS